VKYVKSALASCGHAVTSRMGAVGHEGREQLQQTLDNSVGQKLP